MSNIITYGYNGELRYRTKKDIGDECQEFWYTDIKHILKDKNFIMIDQIFVPQESRNQGVGTNLIKEFTSIYKDSIILLRSSLLTREYHTEPTNEQYNEVLNKLEDFFTRLDFSNFNQFSKSYEFSELYVYTGNDIGKEIYKEIEKYYKE